jgi:hypothetical protein
MMKRRKGLEDELDEGKDDEADDESRKLREFLLYTGMRISIHGLSTTGCCASLRPAVT